MTGTDQIQEAPDFSEDDWNSVSEERKTGVAPAVVPPQEDSQTVKQPEETKPDEHNTAPAADLKQDTDPYEGLSPAIRAKLEKFDQVAEMLPQLNTTLKETAGRVGSLQSQWAKHQQQLASQPTPAELEQAAKGKKSWQAIKEEHPDWAEGIESFVSEKTKPGLSAEELEQQIAQQYQEKFAAETAKLSRAIVRIAHPKWEQDIRTPEFAGWMAGQDDTVKAQASSQDPEDAIALLNSYYASRKTGSDPRDKQRKLEAATEVRTPSRQAASTSLTSDDGMSEAELWEQEMKRRQARRAA